MRASVFPKVNFWLATVVTAVLTLTCTINTISSVVESYMMCGSGWTDRVLSFFHLGKLTRLQIEQFSLGVLCFFMPVALSISVLIQLLFFLLRERDVISQASYFESFPRTCDGDLMQQLLARLRATKELSFLWASAAHDTYGLMLAVFSRRVQDGNWRGLPVLFSSWIECLGALHQLTNLRNVECDSCGFWKRWKLRLLMNGGAVNCWKEVTGSVLISFQELFFDRGLYFPFITGFLE